MAGSCGSKPSGIPSGTGFRTATPAMPLVILVSAIGFCLFGGYGGRGAGNAGRPAPVTSVRILDADGRECGIGAAGEICVHGSTVHLGYWNRPEINSQRFRGIGRALAERFAHVWAARAELRAPRDPGVVPVPERRLHRHVRPAAGHESTAPPDGGALGLGEVLMPEDVAGTVIEAMDAERFLILPHPRVGASFLRKATDYDAWLSRTRSRLQGI